MCWCYLFCYLITCQKIFHHVQGLLKRFGETRRTRIVGRVKWGDAKYYLITMDVVWAPISSGSYWSISHEAIGWTCNLFEYNGKIMIVYNFFKEVPNTLFSKKISFSSNVRVSRDVLVNSLRIYWENNFLTKKRNLVPLCRNLNSGANLSYSQWILQRCN